MLGVGRALLGVAGAGIVRPVRGRVGGTGRAPGLLPRRWSPRLLRRRLLPAWGLLPGWRCPWLRSRLLLRRRLLPARRLLPGRGSLPGWRSPRLRNRRLRLCRGVVSRRLLLLRRLPPGSLVRHPWLLRV